MTGGRPDRMLGAERGAAGARRPAESEPLGAACPHLPPTPGGTSSQGSPLLGERGFDAEPIPIPFALSVFPTTRDKGGHVDTASAGYTREHECSYAQLRITASMFSVRLCTAGSHGNSLRLLRVLSVH